MKIDAVDFFPVATPAAQQVRDSTQETLLVRVRAGGYEGWGECALAPLTAIASLIGPPSHGGDRPFSAAVVGARLDQLDDIARIAEEVRARSLDPLAAAQALSGIDIALWDLMGKRLEQPTCRLLGYPKAFPKLPYTSIDFGETGVETLSRAKSARQEGFRAVKFGGGLFGKIGPKEDQEHLVAAREGLGTDGMLLVDARSVWGDDLPRAVKSLRALRLTDVVWLQDPLAWENLPAYASLSEQAGRISIAAGQECHHPRMAQHLMDYGRVKIIQIDAGRIGGISSAKQVADMAVERNVTYLNHAAPSHLALSAALQPYAGLADHKLCAYPNHLGPVARALTVDHLRPEGEEGLIYLPDAPGHGMVPDLNTVRAHLVDVEISLGGKMLYRTPAL